MRIAVISDIHIKSKDSDSFLIFKNFLDTISKNKYDEIIFLGDLFDVFHGAYDEFVKDNIFVFNEIYEFLKINNKVKVHFVDGNHDVHYSLLNKESLFKEYSSNIFFHTKHIVKVIENKKFLFIHGDYLEIENKTYLFYKNLLTSFVFKSILPKIIPYSFLTNTAQNASKNSKKKGQKYFNKELFLEKYQKGARSFFYKGFDVVVAGHTHIKDFYDYEDDGVVKSYINNGDATLEKSFISIDESGMIQFTDLF